MRCIFVSMVACLFLSLPAFSQTLPAPMVVSPGEATVYGTPAYADFWLHFESKDADVERAIAGANSFGGDVQRLMTEEELRASEFEVSAPAVIALAENTAKVSARLRFTLTNYTKPEEGPRQFGRLCDTIKRIAEALECEAEGPVLGTTESEELARSAVAAAVEQAYPKADAVAGILKSTVYAVDTIEIGDVTFNQALDTRWEEPNLRQISCSARVKVTYTLASQP